MNPFLVAPAASAAASAAKGGVAAASSALTTASSGADFQRYTAGLQASHGVDANQLVGLKSGDLQEKISSLTSSQKISLAQQLVGSTVTVVNQGGQFVQGKAEKLQISHGVPTFQVAGQSYSLSQLASVAKTA
ncbi:MAG: hypothetical protein PW734_09895 [Verrucomicrobium sp.]|nr:hypothetical protein [Verrucomicrobium sp.]